MTKFVFHGGVNEIGGNKILIEDSGTRVFLDFGLSFGQQRKYYDEFLGARGFAIIEEYISFGLLPAVKGIYREDHLEHMNSSNPALGTSKKKSVEAILISHAHMDHVGMVPYLRPDITLVGSETTWIIMKYLQETMTGDEQEFCTWYPSFKMTSRQRGRGLKRATKTDVEDEKIERPFVKTQRKKSFQVGNIEATAYHVDHSLPGSDAYILSTDCGTVAYTGDLRFHGYFSSSSKEFMSALEGANVRVLLCEGTRAKDAPGMTEKNLEKEMTDTIEDSKALVLVNYAQRDISRMVTISNAARACGRKLLVSPKQAYFLSKMLQTKDIPAVDSKNIEVLLPRKSWGIWANSDYDEEAQLQDYSYSYPKPVREFVFEDSVLVTPQEVANEQKEYVVTCSFYDLGILHDFKPREGSKFLWSASEPYDEEGEIELERVKRWLNHFGLGEPVMKHCSGHLSGREVKELIERVKPEIVVPIHTEHPEVFKDWHRKVKIMKRDDVLEL